MESSDQPCTKQEPKHWQEPNQWQELNQWQKPKQEREPVARPAPATDAFRHQSSRGERVRSWRSGPEVTTGAAPALSSHPRWRELRLGSRLEGDPAAGGRLELGLHDLLDHLRANSHDPALELEEALDRRSPGLGTELRWVLAGPASRQHQARWDQENHRQKQAQRERQARSQQQADRERETRRQRAEALIVLELCHGASLAAVKAAHRRLVKCHHPDMGGDAEAFRRINAAYQLLIA